MRTDLDHLPAYKRRELELALKILFEEFDAIVRAGTSEYKRRGRIMAVVLFGSYATGRWVQSFKWRGYKSDYDILIVVNHDKLTDTDLWRFAEQRLMQEETITRRIRTPVNFIVHSAADVNDQLAHGRYFFKDIAEQGIALYQAPDHRFVQPATLPEDVARAEAQRYFEHWLLLAGHAIRLAKTSVENGVLRDAAFMLHQATERLYHCLLLVHTLYTPKTHNLKFLRSRAEALDPRLIAAWPRSQRQDKRRFELLKRAYVEARYSEQYVITEEELDWLAERVEHLRALVEQSCRARLAL